MGSTYIWIIIIIIIIIIINSMVNKKITDNKINKNNTENNTYNIKINDYPYKSKMLLTKTEYNFYKELRKFLDEKQYIVCPKIRLEDFIYVTNKQELYKYRGYIKSRHIDFLICDNDLHIKFAIELDDKTHNTEKAKSTDEFKNKLFDTINIKLYRIKVGDNYENEIKKIFNLT